MSIKIDRTWSMPNKWTFTIGPIAVLLAEEMGGGEWIDPFAGLHSLATVTNDLNPDMPAQSHMDALEFLKSQPSSRYDGGLYDPPYSITQAVECYKGFGKEQLGIGVHSMAYWSRCKNEMARIIKAGGKCICCGWNTNGLGNRRGFVLDRILIVAHGGSKNDTLVTVEHKAAVRLF